MDMQEHARATAQHVEHGAKVTRCVVHPVCLEVMGLITVNLSQEPGSQMSSRQTGKT